MPQAKLKEERIHLRLNTLTKKKIERAAELSGATITDFVISTAVSKADQVIGEQERITLYGRDRDAFLQAVLNPEKPTKALIEAMAHHRRLNRKPARKKK